MCEYQNNFDPNHGRYTWYTCKFNSGDQIQQYRAWDESCGKLGIIFTGGPMEIVSI